ncbi:type III-A CRISPR-associated RAMP protein Csm3 [Nitrosomonas ureae]|uniref:CRISPR system Cms endoribonuclease Csm3 n=1 Tax=Nitrosomonas ureae TaxID=44577 RepID=A0A2T5IUG2_9PROT|nr:type III-A CRISPR-associated RAMP protein Csm3 [Nitrosomonas ureae]PTQ87500.1 CRISPR-associated Csm3 family protein [Nitrosomonas ureae]PXX17116.1 CRISPR-associated Csm3 family protein [Nitrosomonas ureae]
MSEQTNPKLKSKIFIKGKITALTGLHIGGNSIGMAIGGADKVVVRNPLTNEPYIPGSSLRGKMRSLLERARGDEKHSPKEGGFSLKDGKLEAGAGINPETLLGKLFGVSADKNNGQPTRLMVRDAHLTRESKKQLENAPNTDMPMTEVKTEVNIDRITSAANPRQFERVPAGAEFNFELVLTLLESDDEKQFLNLIREGLELVQHDSLGGHGSRGYGAVEFRIETVQERTMQHYQQGQAASDVSDQLAVLFVNLQANAPAGA